MNTGLSVLIATYNEKDNIKSLFDSLKIVKDELAIDLQVVVVDDNSPDKTAVEVLRLSPLYSFDLVLIKRPRKLGLGTAYRAGIKACTLPYTAILDADLSHDPTTLIAMMMSASPSRVVVATRYAYGGTTENWGLRRILTSQGANMIARTAMSMKLGYICRCTDVTGSFRIYPTETLNEALCLSMSKGFSIQIELLRLCLDLSSELVEVPISFRDRVAGQSKLSPAEYISFLRTCYQLAFI